MPVQTWTPGQVLTAAQLTTLTNLLTFPVVTTVSVNPCVAGNFYRCQPAGGGSLTMTLPAPTTVGLLVGFKLDAANGSVVVNRNATESIYMPEGTSRGLTTYTLSSPDASLVLISDGTNWHALFCSPSTPVGTVCSYAGASAPQGWLMCDGSAVSRTTYAALFAVLSTTFGAGDGSTTFNLPDMRGRTAQGVGSVGTNAQPTLALAGSGGEQNHTLVTGELAAHNHTDSGHGHTVTYQNNTPDQFVSSGGTNSPAAGSNWDGRAVIVAGGSGAANIQNTGSGTAHNNMAPYLALNHIIKM